jgi:amidase
MARVTDRRLSRRAFLGASAAGGAALLLGGSSAPALAKPKKPSPDENAPWFEATIPQLQALMASRELSSLELTKAYLHRIKELNPLLGAVIETNPQAIGIAAQRDAERRRRRVRGPLHGIPVLVKDNIATDDRMDTTAGSLALRGSRVPADAALVASLRRAGAVILGKANLSEWANFRGFIPAGFPNGWSARGGFTRNPYVLDWDPCGSSSGSAVAAAANLCSATVGSETDGSILCPAGNNGVVGLKPTLGLVPQTGIIPIAHSQDTAGPITRTVTDAAIMLNAMRAPFGPVLGHPLPPDYTAFLQRGALDGAVVGVDRLNFQEEYFAVPELNEVTERALDVMASLGATIVDIEIEDCPDPNDWFDPEFTVLLNEFKHDVAAYMSTLSHTRMRTLADLIQFNIDHCPQEMRHFGQELFELAETFSGDLSDPDYLAARADSFDLAGPSGLDRVLDDFGLDVLVSPAYSVGYSAAAVAGYASMSVPAGLADDGRPGCVFMSGRFLDEPKLIGFAYDLEQELGARDIPQFLGNVAGPFPDAGICSTPLRGRGRGKATRAERRQAVAAASPRARASRPGR